MGVTGLWRLLEPAGKPVPLETLENKVLAVDISIWLHQMVKGYQDARGAPLANAHLIGLFQRLCKLLYYRIKPVFVFDGGFPVLKKQTIVKRQNKKAQMHSSVDRVRRQLMDVLTKQSAVKKVLSEKTKSPLKKSPIKSQERDDEELFKLPPLPKDQSVTTTADSSSDESDSEESNTPHIDLHSLDVNSEHFKSLTPREKHDLLSELKETRKQNSWGRLHELPAQSDNFSDYQMSRLLKRRQVQVSLEETEKEMGGHFLSINELEVLMNEEGIDTKIENIPTRRIASDENTRFLLIKDVKEAIQEATKKENCKIDTVTKTENVTPSTSKENESTSPGDLGDEYDDDLKAAIALSLQTPSETESNLSKESNFADFSFLDHNFADECDSDWTTDDESDEESDSIVVAELALAKAYMLEHSGLSEYEIMRILRTKSAKIKKGHAKKKKGLVNTSHKVKDMINKPDGSNNIKKSQGSDNKHRNECKNIHIDDIKSNITETIESNDDDVVFVSPINSKRIENLLSSKESINSVTIDDSSSSDSDGSFEEVPEISKKGNLSDALPPVELILNPKEELEDDIFADIFEKKEDCEEISKISIFRNEMNIMKSVHVPRDESVEMTDCNVPALLDEIIQEPKNTFAKINQSKETPNLDKIEKTKEIPALDKLEELNDTPIIALDKMEKQKEKSFLDKIEESIENTVIVEREVTNENSVLHKSKLERSPQKGIRLSEVVSLVSQDEKNLKKNNKPLSEKETISTEELSHLADNLDIRKDELEKQQNRLDRMGRNISDEMTKDTQDLLQLFGIPFIVAPMEAEAQCAFLETIKLTDGTITDDSDIWLFGGRTVYKNFFNQQKYVLQFLSENILSCFKLPREKLILLALLVGSDYTTGVAGVGPVTALEILAAFPTNNIDIKPPYITLLAGLKKFRNWLYSNRTIGHVGLRNKLKNVSLTEEFPSYKVVEAYLIPEVETSKDEFSWGKPDVTALRDFAKDKFGWSQAKTDEILLPIIKRMDSKISQQSIRSFFRTEVKIDAASEKMSKRVKIAIEKMGLGTSGDDEEQVPKIPKRGRKMKEPKIKEPPIKKTKQLGEPVELVSSKFFEDTTKEADNVLDLPTSSKVESKPKNVGKPKCTDNFIPERYQEKIPQRECDKNSLLKNKMKAIELFRTSKKGPGFIKKRKKTARLPKDDAGLSESSASD